jgi:hypothetical protein
MFVMFVDESADDGCPMVHAIDKISSMWIDGGRLKVQEQGRPPSESSPYDYTKMCERHSEAEVLICIAESIEEDLRSNVIEITTEHIAEILGRTEF